MEQIIHELGAGLSGAIDDGYKYIKSKYILVKKLDDGFKAITIDLNHTTSGYVKLAMYAHIRLNVLEDLYGRFYPFINEKSRKDNPTIVKNCDHLFSDKSLAASFSLTHETMQEVIGRYSKAILEDVIPFLDRFYSIDMLVNNLEDEDSMKWVTSDRVNRFLVLMSAYLLKRDIEAFEKLANDFLDYCAKPHAVAYEQIAYSVVTGLREEFGVTKRG